MKFCDKCGRPLADGEVCSCRSQQAGYAGAGYQQAAGQSARPQQPAQNGYSQQPFMNGGFPPASDARGGYSASGQSQQAGYSAPSGGDFKNKVDDVLNKYDEEKINSKKEAILGKITQTDGIDVYEHNKKIVPDCIKANDGEIPIKQYNFAILRTRIALEKAEGRLQVTNKRLLFRATGRSLMGRTELHEEFNISEIAGVEVRNRHVFSFLKLLVALILSVLFFGIGGGLAAAVMQADSEGLITTMQIFALIWAVIALLGVIGFSFYLMKTRRYNPFYWLRHFIICPALGALSVYATVSAFYSDIPSEVFISFGVPIVIAFLCNLFLMCFVPDLSVSIKTKGALPAVFVAREEGSLLMNIFGGRANHGSGFKEVGPWKDTDQAIKELGTMIDDINTLGDAAIEKWRQR